MAQSKEIICNNAKTFGEIWDSLSKEDKNRLFFELVITGVTNSKVTVWYWATGRRRPSKRIPREALVKGVNRITNSICSFKTLFPLPEDY